MNLLWKQHFCVTLCYSSTALFVVNCWIRSVGISESEDQNDGTDNEEAAEYAAKDEQVELDEHETTEVVNSAVIIFRLT